MTSRLRDWKIGEKRLSTVHFLKLIQTLRDQFPYNALTALIVETLANSLDARSTRIDIFVGNNYFKILDNGKGMNYEEFTDYHNIASLSKKRGEGIGFAGVGAKIFLDRAEYVITETKKDGFHAATRWAFFRESLEWAPKPVQNLVPFNTGTYVEVKLKEAGDQTALTTLFVKQILQQHYNAILLGHYGEKRITINNEVVEPCSIEPKAIETKKEFAVKVGKFSVEGFLIKSTKEVNEAYQGPQIIVHGKTICPYWFRQYPTYGEYFTGMVFADFLIDILTASKSDFDRSSKLWRQFNNRIGKVLGTWLDEIGAKPKLPKPSDDLSSLSQQIEKTVNEILKLPEFTDIANKIFQNMMERTIGIKSELGEQKGVEVEEGQTIKGSLGGSKHGEGLPTVGPNIEPGVIENEQGEAPLERLRRRVRGGIKIGYEERPEELLEAWIDPQTQTITINQGHPSWKVANGLSVQAESEHVTIYHMLRSIFRVLAEEAGVESPEKTTRDLFLSWYEHFIGDRK